MAKIVVVDLQINLVVVRWVKNHEFGFARVQQQLA